MYPNGDPDHYQNPTVTFWIILSTNKQPLAKHNLIGRGNNKEEHIQKREKLRPLKWDTVRFTLCTLAYKTIVQFFGNKSKERQTKSDIGEWGRGRCCINYVIVDEKMLAGV